MKFVVLMAAFILCQISPGLTAMYLPCSAGELYYTCADLCRWGCKWGYEVCLAQCKRGCGCGRKTLIMIGRNQCRLLEKCKK